MGADWNNFVRRRATRTIGVAFFASLILSLNGVIFGHDAEATWCFSTENLLLSPKEDVAIVTATITSSETKTYDPPEMVDGYDPTSNRVTTTFTIDEVVYGNADFPLESDSINLINSDPKNVGDRYVAGYYLFDDGWGMLNCTTLEPASFAGFATFYEDLLENPCRADHHYLIKNSDHVKICVSHDTRDKLIERGIGFFVPNLSFREWNLISNNPPLDVSAYGHKPINTRMHCDAFTPDGDCYLAEGSKQTDNRLRCDRAVESSTDDYCIPYWISLSLKAKEGNTNVSISDLPNLGETATVTVSNMDPKIVFPRQYDDDYHDFGIKLSHNLVFVNTPESERTYRGSTYYQTLPPSPESFHLEATIQAVSEGPATVTVNGRSYGDDVMHFNVANKTTTGHPIKNFRGDTVFVTLASDKQHYEYGEPVIISGQFSDYVGRWVAFGAGIVPIDSENRFITQAYMEDIKMLATEEVYLVLRDRHFTGVEQIKIKIDRIDLPPPNRPPHALIGTASTIAENTAGMLTGIGSDPDKDPLTYSWEQTGGPDAALTDHDMPVAKFTAPEIAEDTYVTFTLTVSDGDLHYTSEIRLKVTNSPDGT